MKLIPETPEEEDLVADIEELGVPDVMLCGHIRALLAMICLGKLSDYIELMTMITEGEIRKFYNE